MKEIAIANNMIALARSKGANKRSAMLRMIMPFLSRDTGDKLSSVIHNADSHKFATLWDKVKHEIMHKLEQQHKHKHHKATAATVSTFTHANNVDAHVNITSFDGEKVTLILNGQEVKPPAIQPTKISVKIDSGNTGSCFEGQTTNEEFVCMIRAVCEALINKLDPCPLPEVGCPNPEGTVVSPIEELCMKMLASNQQ